MGWGGSLEGWGSLWGFMGLEVPIGLGGSLWGWVYGDPTSHMAPQIVSPIEDEWHGGGAVGWGGYGVGGLLWGWGVSL